MKVVCLVTINDVEKGKELARTLLEARLIACANLIPQVTSLYWWEGKIQEDAEVLLVLKTTRERVEALIAAVKQHHPYTVPEVISLPIEQGNPDYLAWIDESLAQT